MTNLQISDPRLARALAGAGKWARILAIISFVFIGIFALVMLLAFGTIMGLLALQPQFAGLASLGAAGVGVLFAVYFAIFAYFSYLLFRFGTLLRGARDQPISNAAIEEAFGHYARLMMFSVGFLVLAVVVGLVFPLLAVGGLGDG